MLLNFLIFICFGLSYANKTNNDGFFDIDLAISQNFYSSQKNQIINEPVDNSKKLICYYVFTNDFTPDIMNDLCTHINIGFFHINVQNHSLYTSAENFQIVNEIVALKQKNEPKVIISVGGAGDKSFISMIGNHTTRKMFVKSSMSIIKKYKIDGIDIDWEWPVTDGNPKEKIKFVQLLREIRNEFNRHKKKYILSVDVPSAREIVELGFYVNYIAEIVNYVNVMCYDYHFYKRLYPLTGYNAPLYSSKTEMFKNFNVNYSINYWISQKMPREKIVLGVPTYGHTYKLLVPHKHDLKAPAVGYGSIGHDGFADYREICDFINQSNVTVIYDDVSKVPYAYQGLEWISLDNEMSLTQKVNYAIDENLSGVMVFSVNSDDYLGICNNSGKKLPLIKKIRSVLFKEDY